MQTSNTEDDRPMKRMRTEEPWIALRGVSTIFREKHLVTFRGSTEGGYAYLSMEHEPGWYLWYRHLFQQPVYVRLPEGTRLIYNYRMADNYIREVPRDYRINNDLERDVLPENFN